MGTPRFAHQDVGALRTVYEAATRIAANAQVVVGASADQSALEAGLGWPGSGVRLHRGHDGADLALIDLLEHESIPARFGQVFLGSGDGIFATVASVLSGQGVEVTVVSRRTALSRSLLMAASRVIYLDDSDLAAAQRLAAA